MHPSVQGRGIGRALIEDGLAQLRAQGAQGCVVLGDPALYCHFGFARSAGLTYDGAPPEYFLAQSFGGSVPAGVVRYHLAFATEPAPRT